MLNFSKNYWNPDFWFQNIGIFTYFINKTLDWNIKNDN